MNSAGAGGRSAVIAQRCKGVGSKFPIARWRIASRLANDATGTSLRPKAATASLACHWACSRKYRPGLESKRRGPYRGKTSTVSGLYLAHSQAHYFGVAKVERDQVEDYARRKGMPVAEVERWLAPILNYEPAAQAAE